MPDNRINNAEQGTSSCLLTTLGFFSSFVSNQPSVRAPQALRSTVRQTNLGLASIGMSVGFAATITTGPVNGAVACAIPNLMARTNTAGTQINHPPRNVSEALDPFCAGPESIINTATLFAPGLSAPAPAYIMASMANLSVVRSAIMNR